MNETTVMNDSENTINVDNSTPINMTPINIQSINLCVTENTEQNELMDELMDRSDLLINLESKDDIETCVIEINSSDPYDTSTMSDNPKTFCASIAYETLPELISIFSNDENEREIISNINLLFIKECLKKENIKIIVRFLCSCDCNNGSLFVDLNTTELVFKFLELLSERDTIIELSDHSISSVINNWDKYIKDIPKPIEMSRETCHGSFKMYGKKEDFENSEHPTLKMIGILAENNIEINFNNMSGTKIFIIINPNVKLISKGYQINSFDNYQREIPVHCEFYRKKSKYIISSTHWCNLTEVENKVNLKNVREYVKNFYGENTASKLDGIEDESTLKRCISDSVRQLSSGNRQEKRSKLFT